MTPAVVLFSSISRSILLATIGLPISRCLHAVTRGPASSPQLRHHLSRLALIPLFVPDLLTGFCYRLTAARLIHSDWASEGLYAGLLLIRIVALQLALRIVLPGSALNSHSLHAWKLLQNRTRNWSLNWGWMLVLGPWRTPLLAWIGGAVLCFQEFETAALVQIDRHPIVYSVWLFDAHAAGEPLLRSLWLVLPGLIWQTFLLAIACALVSRRLTTTASTVSSTAGPAAGTVSVVFIAVALWTTVLWPVVANFAPAVEGLKGQFGQHQLPDRLGQIVSSLAIAACAATFTLLLAYKLSRTRSRWLICVTVLPGLCGPLVLSLVLLWLFQLPGLRIAYDTFVPWVVGLVLLMLPRALLLMLLLRMTTGRTARHAAGLLLAGRSSQPTTGRDLLWQLSTSRWLLAAAILTHWSFWDVTTASMLRPVHFEPVVTRLYNEMHYGHTETLVAITLLATGIPIAIYAIAALVTRSLLLRWIPRTVRQHP